LSGIKASTGERIFKDIGGEGVAVLCKATGLKRPFLRDMWTALGRPVDNTEFARVSDVYETIAVAKAQTVLRYWNWSLSSAFAPEALMGEGDEIEEDSGFARELRMIDAARPKTAFGR
ncbi:MAG: DUF2336 domain-containing protein, partial [Alphaproteobacteria bacterium]